MSRGRLRTYTVHGGDEQEPPAISRRSRRAAAGRVQLLAKGQNAERLQVPAELRHFRIGHDKGQIQSELQLANGNLFLEILAIFR